MPRLRAAPPRMKASWLRACGTPPSADGIRALRSAFGMSTLPLRSVLNACHRHAAPRAHTVLSANVRASGQASLPVCASTCRVFIVSCTTGGSRELQGSMAFDERRPPGPNKVRGILDFPVICVQPGRFFYRKLCFTFKKNAPLWIVLRQNGRWRLRGPPQAENPAKQDSFLFL